MTHQRKAHLVAMAAAEVLGCQPCCYRLGLHLTTPALQGEAPLGAQPAVAVAAAAEGPCLLHRAAWAVAAAAAAEGPPMLLC